MNDWQPNCTACCDTGWVTVEATETRPSSARRCPCRPIPDQQPETGSTPITSKAIAGAVKALEALAYFPKAEGQVIVGDALREMCATVEQLRWLVRAACGQYVKWEDCGIPGLREILRGKFTPAELASRPPAKALHGETKQIADSDWQRRAAGER